ncbi:hypothetical protein QFC22_003765 [Naganishia vaughanmartiniae]|uniref:Uncharacterized protein n=1 Tax=Naganishia vaughanmartiniae TaxID=1424756 RepID=A0ACC2X550_9TREE|nr:hypothetical protein QFC22_003765 [Naganishia vaughanmartiniae]
MSTNSVDLPPTTAQAIRKFRFKRFKGDAALVVKIDKKTLTMVVDEELEGTLEEIGEGEYAIIQSKDSVDRVGEGSEVLACAVDARGAGFEGKTSQGRLQISQEPLAFTEYYGARISILLYAAPRRALSAVREPKAFDLDRLS